MGLWAIGDLSTFIRTRDTFSRFCGDCVFRGEKEEEHRGNGKEDYDFKLDGCVWESGNYGGC